LKVIRSRARGADAVRRFEGERQILASLDHPHIARLLDGGVTPGGQPFFTLEYVEGEPITTYCAREGLDLEARLTLFADACGAVQHAQERLVIHRDLKPSNILVSDEGAVKLLDFGIAKVLDAAAEPGLTRHGARLLTPGYGAPEQIRGEPVTTATDVFALGVVLYELLTGVAPHAARSAEAAESSVLSQTPTRPSAAALTPALEPGRLEGDLDTICLTALRKEASERYPSAAALLDDLRLYRDGRPIRARPLTLSYQLSKVVRRHRTAVLAGLAGLLALVGLVSVYTLRLAAERDRAQTEAQKAAAVARFVADLFTESDPRWSQGRKVTAREVLERGAGRVETELSRQPEVRASLQATIGRAYRGLGLFEEASTHLRGALSALDGVEPDDDARRAEVALSLAEVLTDRGLYDEAEPLFEAARAARKQFFGDTSPESAEVLRALGSMHTANGNFDAAEPLLRAAVAIYRPQDSLPYARSLSALGLLLHEKNAYKEAEALYREGLALAKARAGSVHPLVSELLYNLGQLLRDNAEYEASRALHEEALSVDRKLYGDAHPAVADSMTNLGQLLVAQGRLGEASELMREAYEMRTELLEPDHPDIGRALARLAQVEHQRGEWAVAEKRYRQTLEHQMRSLGPKHPLIAGRMNNLSWILHDLGRFAEARAWAEKGLALNLETRKPSSMSVGISRLHLARALRGAERYKQALEEARSALDIGEAAYGEKHPFPASVRNTLAQIHLGAGDVEAADREASAAQAALKGKVPDDHPRVAAVQATLGRVRAAQGRSEEARRWLEKAVTTRTEVFGAHHPLTLRATRWLEAAAE
ncbi:MAG: tetratricopeptide repeat protein, partial [Myxococcota bacterium]